MLGNRSRLRTPTTSQLWCARGRDGINHLLRSQVRYADDYVPALN